MTTVLVKRKIVLILFLSVNYSYVYTQSYNDLKKDTANFSSKTLDLNLDGKLDIIFYHKWLQGDTMYFFINKGKNYEQALKTINFSFDGLYKIEKIESVKNNNVVLKISTLSYSKENRKAIYFIRYENNRWYLQKTIYESEFFDPTIDQLIHSKCILYNQNILLSENNLTTEIFNFRDKNCTNE